MGSFIMVFGTTISQMVWVRNQKMETYTRATSSGGICRDKVVENGKMGAHTQGSGKIMSQMAKDC